MHKLLLNEMDKEYRKALKIHLMKAFAANKSDNKEKNQRTTSSDLVHALFSTPSIVVSKSRIIDALIDTPLQTARENYEHYDTGTKYCQCSLKEEDSTTTKHQRDKVTSPTIKHHVQRMEGGDNTNIGCSAGPANSQTNFSVFTFNSTNPSTRSRTPSFRKRTARELSSMVLAECELVESLNLMESDSSQHRKTDKSILDLPIVLWRSKKEKFNSSVDLRFDSSPTESSLYQHKATAKSQAPQSVGNEQSKRATERQESLIDEDDILDAEGIIRKQFTGPLIRHVERNYVRNITATADLLKMLERMPADIDRVLAKECSK